MADKVQNITINYKFNTAEIDRANAILNRANQATNNLQTTSQKAGQQINTSYGQARSSIAAMEVSLARLKTQIQVSSDPKRVAELSNQYKVLKTQIDAANKSAFGTTQAMKASQTASQSAAQSFGQLYTAAKLFVTAGVAKEVVDMALAMASLSGRVEGVSRAFDRAFPNQIKVLNDLREATHGTITDFELMQRTLQATNLGVGIQQLPQLFEFAAARAQQTGESVDYLVDSIVRGIGRKSALILDNLGISAIRLKEELGGVSLQAASVGEVTRAVGKIAEEELGKMGGYAETSETKVKQLTVAYEQLKITLSKNLATGGLVDFLKNSVNNLNFILDADKRSGVDFIRQSASRTAANIVEKESYKDLGDNIQAKIDVLQQEINTRIELIGRANDTIVALETERQLLRDKNPYDSHIDSITENINVQKRHKFEMASVILTLKEYRKELEKPIKTEEVEPTGIISRLKEKIKLKQEEIELTNNLNDISRYETDALGNTTLKVGKLTKQLEIMQAELGDFQRAFSEIDIKPLDLQFKDFNRTSEEGIDFLSRFRGELDKLSQSELLDANAGAIDKFDSNIKRIEDGLKQIAGITLTPPPDTVAKVDSFWDLFGEHLKDNWRDITADAIDLQADMINSLIEAEIDSLNNQLDNTKNFYAQQQQLAGDNARAKSELRVREDQETALLSKRIFEREKKLRKAQAVVDGAAAVIKAFVTAPNVYVAIVQAALITAKTIAQLSVIDRAKGYAKGVIDLKGPGTGTSDSIPARLSKGESVMTAWETRHAGDVLHAVRAKKLDNKVLKDLRQGRAAIQSESFNDQGIIKAIKDNRPPDVIVQAGIVYTVEKSNDTYLRKIRAKSIRL